MAEQGRVYRQQSSASTREAAFSNIFGAAPPSAGRSQTMSSQSTISPPQRSQTLTSLSPHPSTMSDGSARPSVPQNKPNGYLPQQANGYPVREGPNGHYQPQRGPTPPNSNQASQYQYPMANGPDIRGYPQSHRGPPSNNYPKPAPNRFYPPQQGGPNPRPGPALNSDPYRSRSLAGSGYNMAQLQNGPIPYRPGAPPQNPMARQTAQGRHIPERADERTMSLTSVNSVDRDALHTQTMSGRSIPPRRRESDGESFHQQQLHQPYSTPPPQPEYVDHSYTSSPLESRSPNNIERPIIAHHSSTPRLEQRDSTTSNTSVSTIATTSTTGKPRTPSYASTTSSYTAVPSTTSSYTAASSTDPSLHSRPSVATKGSAISSSHGTILTAARRTPLVYPALLSRVAETFRERLAVGDRIKNELTYKSAFTGAEAVDMISYIIKTSDRNLALLLGRALDAQKFFHDVTYDHRLRDSASEVYQFRERLVDEDRGDVNGVFTLLTECYSPTCTRDRLCYSIACPRRLEQQARLNMQPVPGLKRESSRSSLHDGDDKEQKLWIHTVPKEIAESVDDREKKRQEVICEAIYTERDFVKDLEYLRDFWMKPLRSGIQSPIPEHRREKFIRTVFSNVLEVHNVNCRLAEALTRRQQSHAVVRNVGEIFLEYVPLFEPFVKYGANQLYGKYEFEKEKSSNPAFAKFVEETERLKESRKLELNGYLTKPTTRLARYPLLLEAILKSTSDDNPDKKDLPKAIELIRECLSKVNVESGRSENHFNLMQLDAQLQFRPGEKVDLKLTEEGRQLIFKGNLKKSPTDNSGQDIQVFLFDHALLLVRIKIVNKKEQYKVHRRPIPLELLVISEMAEVLLNARGIKRPPSSLIPGMQKAQQKADPNVKGYPITFQHLGRRGWTLPLWATTVVGRRKWMEHIEAQQAALRERSNVFTKTILCQDFFNVNTNKVNCLVPMDGGRKLVYGTDTGIYLSDRKPNSAAQSTPRKVIDLSNVVQVDVLEEYQLLLSLSEKSVFSFPMDSLMEAGDTQLVNKRHKRIFGHTNFFKTGICLGRVLVCCVKTSAMSSTVKVFEPLDNLARGKRPPAFRFLLSAGQDAFKPFKEFYIPSESSSIHFLKSKLCVGCSKGFEVVSLETLETQSLLDPADTSLDFVQRRENVKPIAIYRLNGGEFLLNYSDFSFFVNRNGWRARPEWLIQWEGNPTSFALQPPYILAFESSFIEIRNMETGGLVSIVTGKNIRMLHESSREILYAYEEEGGEDIVASLDFWSKPR